ncbi:MAG: dihydrolipoamide acetyltransferase family protein [Thermoplasmatales archaeon]
MPTFKLPDIGEGVQEGEIVKWNVKEGDEVHKDQIIVEVMTDKVTVQIPSPYEGKVSKIYVKQGEIAKVGSPLIDIGTSPSEAVESAPASKNLPKEEEAAQVLAPPAVRKKAREMGIDLTTVKGSGPGGRITLQDLEGYGKQQAVVEAKSPPSNVMELKGLRRLISEKMTKSKQIIPHYAVAEEVNMDALSSLRDKLKELGVNLSYTPFFVKASVLALKEYPYLNARSTEDGKFEILNYYNIGIAIDTPEGLTVAVVKDADKKSIREIYREIEDLASRAREGKLRLDEVKDSTFTVTNVGSIGGIFSTPIINYPEVAILGVHRIMDTPSGKSMFITLSADHRLIDGAMAARFIVQVKRYLEEPSYMLV